MIKCKNITDRKEKGGKNYLRKYGMINYTTMNKSISYRKGNTVELEKNIH